MPDGHLHRMPNATDDDGRVVNTDVHAAKRVDGRGGFVFEERGCIDEFNGASIDSARSGIPVWLLHPGAGVCLLVVAMKHLTRWTLLLLIAFVGIPAALAEIACGIIAQAIVKWSDK